MALGLYLGLFLYPLNTTKHKEKKNNLEKNAIFFGYMKIKALSLETNNGG